MATVSADTAMVRPAVSTVRTMAASTLRPARNSSRYLDTMNSE